MPRASEGMRTKRAVNRLVIWSEIGERIPRLYHALTGNKSRKTKLLTPKQESDLRELLGDNKKTTQFIQHAETALYIAHELDIGLDLLGKKRLRVLCEAAEQMRILASVIERAERGNIKDGIPPREIGLFFYFAPTLAKRIVEDPVRAWRMGDTGATQVRAWMEAVEDTAQHLLAGTGGRGRDKNRCRHVAIRWLEKGWNETQPAPDAKDMFIRAVTIILAPQNTRLRQLQAWRRRVATSPRLQRELAELEKADKSARDRIRHQVSAALKIQG